MDAASFSRLILLDNRGTGLSGRTRDLPDPETRMDDIRAVMDLYRAYGDTDIRDVPPVTRVPHSSSTDRMSGNPRLTSRAEYPALWNESASEGASTAAEPAKRWRPQSRASSPMFRNSVTCVRVADSRITGARSVVSVAPTSWALRGTARRSTA